MIHAFRQAPWQAEFDPLFRALYRRQLRPAQYHGHHHNSRGRTGLLTYWSPPQLGDLMDWPQTLDFKQWNAESKSKSHGGEKNWDQRGKGESKTSDWNKNSIKSFMTAAKDYVWIQINTRISFRHFNQLHQFLGAKRYTISITIDFRCNNTPENVHFFSNLLNKILKN